MDNPQTTLAQYGRTFHWAGKFLRADVLQNAARLYQFCRHLDDLADLPGDPAQIQKRLAQVRVDVETNLTNDAEVRDFLNLTQPHPLARRAALLMIDTFLRDLGPVRIGTETELLSYCLGVAGTVGIMMATILGATPLENALPHAIDLGIAMQLTNIARDVQEDAERDRIYLPGEWLAGRDDAWPAVLRVLDLAESYYKSGARGLCYLPSGSRVAIRVASRCYRRIGLQLRERGAVGPRIVVSSVGKGLETLKALFSWSGRSAHSRSLHAPLLPLLTRYELEA